MMSNVVVKETTLFSLYCDMSLKYKGFYEVYVENKKCGDINKRNIINFIKNNLDIHKYYLNIYHISEDGKSQYAPYVLIVENDTITKKERVENIYGEEER